MKKYVRLQKGYTNTGETHRILLPIKLQRELEKQFGKPFKQGGKWEITTLLNEPGYILRPCE